jgi:hypothetical protein
VVLTRRAVCRLITVTTEAMQAELAMWGLAAVLPARIEFARSRFELACRHDALPLPE